MALASVKLFAIMSGVCNHFPNRVWYVMMSKQILNAYCCCSGARGRYQFFIAGDAFRQATGAVNQTKKGETAISLSGWHYVSKCTSRVSV